MDSDASSALDGADSIQESLMSEAVIQVTEHDEVIGPISKLDSHYKEGKFHRAFSVLLFDSSGRLLLQKRASHKITFPNVWANSCCSHPLYSEEEMETKNALGVKRAAIRKLEKQGTIYRAPEKALPQITENGNLYDGLQYRKGRKTVERYAECQ